jgi:hypothetical protein
VIQAAFQFYWGNVFLFIIAALISYFAFLGFFGQAIPNPALDSKMRLVTSLSWSVICLSLLQMIYYLVLPNYLDYGEPLMAILAGNLRMGGDVYSDWTAGGSIVGSNYGPISIIVQSMFLVFGGSIFLSKLPGIIFAVLSLYIFFVTLRRYIGGSAVLVLAAMVILLSCQRHFWYWNRPEPYLFVLVTLSIFIYDRCRAETCLIACGLFAGIALQLKLFTPIYLLPIAVTCVADLGRVEALWRSLLIGGALFVVSAILPYSTGPIEWRPYFANIAMMRHQGVELASILTTFMYFILIIAPTLYVSRVSTLSSSEKVLLSCLCAGGVIMSALAGKPGGGHGYVMHFIPTALYLNVKVWGRVSDVYRPAIRSILVRYFAIILIGLSPIWAYSWYQMSKQLVSLNEELGKRNELRALFKAYSSAQMGHGLDEPSEFYRVEKSFLGQIVHFDYVNYGDQRKAGIEPSVMYHLLENCRVPNWIFSKRGSRFVGTAYGVQLFDDGVRQRFEQNYELDRSGEFYEVWSCRH